MYIVLFILLLASGLFVFNLFRRFSKSSHHLIQMIQDIENQYDVIYSS